MKELKLIDLKDSSNQELYSYKVSFWDEDDYKVFVVNNHLILYSREKLLDGSYLANQLELPLDSMDFILATVARYNLPLDKGGLGGLNSSDDKIINGEKILLMKYIHPHYGIETFDLVNFNRKSYIDPDNTQSLTIFKESLDNGLLDFLVQLNKDYHDGKFN